jgi:prevent-host-death family protein
MATWGVAEAKAKFSEVLDKSESEGPQLVRRRKREFYVLTKEQFEQKKNKAAPAKRFVSGWDALAPSSGATFDADFSRLRSKPRAAKF